MEENATRAHVRETFDRIATDFARTRTYPWDPVTEFLDKHRGATWALDLGCANGRHVPVLAASSERVIGLDLSRELLALATQQSVSSDWIQGDALSLPLANDVIDLAIVIATLHHLPSVRERITSLAELDRVLRPGQPALISVWSISHDRFDFESPVDTWIPWTLPTGDIVDRYYHLYDEQEFRAEIEESPLVLQAMYEQEGNWYAELTSSTP